MKTRVFAPSTRFGTRLPARFAVCVLALYAAGCLVINPIEFDDTVVPASLRDPSPFTFTRAPRGTACMPFRVRVSDPNVNEPLEARLIVNGRRVTGKIIQPNGGVDRGLQDLCASRESLRGACSRVEFVVTSEFLRESDDPYQTTDPMDFVKVEWWVLGPADTNPNADPDDCARLSDGGVL